jgi:hypothetical protein
MQERRVWAATLGTRRHSLSSQDLRLMNRLHTEAGRGYGILLRKPKGAGNPRRSLRLVAAVATRLDLTIGGQVFVGQADGNSPRRATDRSFFQNAETLLLSAEF